MAVAEGGGRAHAVVPGGVQALLDGHIGYYEHPEQPLVRD